MINDPIGDMLARIRNGILADHSAVEMPHSKIKAGIASILKLQGFIEDFSVIEDQKQGILKVYLKYNGPKNNAIAGIRRESKLGRRVYVGHREIPLVRRGLGLAILSTPKGLMTGDEARKACVGGELLLTVW